MAKLRILLRAPENTVFVGKELLHLERVDSTNTYLKDLLSTGKRLNEGLLVFAEEQFAGKGQLGNSWISNPGENITLSVLFYPVFLEIRHIFYFNKAIALAVRDTVNEILKEKDEDYEPVMIKWPNDILIGRKKVAGILIENSLKSTGIENSIVGIGINVNQVFASNTSLYAVSIKEILGEHVDFHKILMILCTFLEKYYLMLRGFKFMEIEDQYHSYLFALGEERNFNVGGTLLKGIIRGVGEKGLLNIEINGLIKQYDMKEIGFVFN